MNRWITIASSRISSSLPSGCCAKSITMMRAEFLKAVKVKYPKAYQCAEKIRAFIESEYGYEFDRSELLYLSVHINRIVKNL